MFDDEPRIARVRLLPTTDGRASRETERQREDKRGTALELESVHS